MTFVPTRILITGANGHIGARLIEWLGEHHAVRALVRSERAAEHLAHSRAEEVRVLDYGDIPAVTRALEGCTHVVHLVGIIKESKFTDYATAHEATTAALVSAAESNDVRRIVYLSILGASETSANRCLASKARAEALLLKSRVPSTIFRVPMVLGEGDYASAALARRAASKLAFTFRASSFEQPIYVDDVVHAVIAALMRDDEGGVHELAGPMSLSRRALLARAGFEGRLISLPLWMGKAAAWVLEHVSASPPFTGTMLDVLDHDDAVDPTPACAAFGIAPTSLDEMLERTVGSKR